MVGALVSIVILLLNIITPTATVKACVGPVQNLLGEGTKVHLYVFS